MKKIFLAIFLLIGFSFVAQNNSKSLKEVSEKPIYSQQEIRMCADINGKQPLYVLNGKVISSRDMRYIETNAIEKVTVLKNKQAIAKYGEQAKNGVIEITTKEKEKLKC